MKIKKNLVFFIFFLKIFFPEILNSKQIQNNSFSKTYSNFINSNNFDSKNVYVWQKNNSVPFDELIFSWNALRPKRGKLFFYVSVKHSFWSEWHRIAEWGSSGQQTFVNSRNYFVHTKHVKIEMQHGKKASGFRIKVVAQDGADIKNLKSLFACVCNMAKLNKLDADKVDLPTIRPIKVPKYSQMVLDHPRYKDLCSPTSMSLIVNYFLKNTNNLDSYIADFAQKVHDDSYLDIYGNWPLNVAQAYDACHEKCFFRVERLNSFYDLYNYLNKGIPVAVSVRGYIHKRVYKNGHFIVVVGWDNKRKSILCIDPSYSNNNETTRAYNIKSFLEAWGNKVSPHLSYVPIPKI
ncbi:C39 family peptidase [Candidatus Babeliales bacterium]|nr:C39 family peptidase [Candidatus Babeliales bacterium]